MRLLILAAVITLAYGHSACPPLWTKFKNSCYRFFPDRLRWEDAKTTCGQFAPCDAQALGQLAQVRDIQSNEFLHRYINGYVSQPPTFDIWIGANDIALEGRHTWSDGTALIYTNWDRTPTAQPDNGAGTGGQPENCVMFGGQKGTWFDAACNRMMAYVCEMPAEPERIPRFGPPYNPAFPPQGPGTRPGVTVRPGQPRF